MLTLSPPTPRGFVSSGWGRPREYRGGWHEGLDFPAAVGTPVLAAADGVVARVDNSNDSFAGRWFAIDHGGGMFTRYLHNTQIDVATGARVRRGQQVATVGTTGTSGSGAPHVHFDVKFLDAAHAAYVARYGTPSTGWGSKMARLGRGVPGETFMRGATYSDMARKWAKDRGVVFYSGLSPLVLLGLAGAGYLTWQALR